MTAKEKVQEVHIAATEQKIGRATRIVVPNYFPAGALVLSNPQTKGQRSVGARMAHDTASSRRGEAPSRLTPHPFSKEMQARKPKH